MTGANNVTRVLCSACCLLFLASHAAAGSIADRYTMHVVLDPDRGRLAVSGDVVFVGPHRGRAF